MKKKIIAISPAEQQKEITQVAPPEKIKVAAYCRVSSETENSSIHYIGEQNLKSWYF